MYMCEASDIFKTAWRDGATNTSIRNDAKRFLGTAEKYKNIYTSHYPATLGVLFRCYDGLSPAEAEQLRFDFLEWAVENCPD